MDIISGDFYQENCQTKNSSLINFKYDTQDYLIYEVLRTTLGVVIFFEDHLERMKNSLVSLGIRKRCDAKNIHNCLKNLIALNGYRTGNVKLLCKIAGDKLYFTSYYIPHEYPSDDLYRKGVKLITYKIERPDPDIKQVHVSEFIRKEIESVKAQAPAYEVLLIDRKGFITEGSRSNIFLINNGKLYSPPDESLLPGITRKYVLRIARDKKIQIIRKPIRHTEISTYESAFICGTSPKILPVNTINNCTLQINNEITYLILKEYNSIIQKYIEKR